MSGIVFIYRTFKVCKYRTGLLSKFEFFLIEFNFCFKLLQKEMFRKHLKHKLYFILYLNEIAMLGTSCHLW